MIIAWRDLTSVRSGGARCQRAKPMLLLRSGREQQTLLYKHVAPLEQRQSPKIRLPDRTELTL